MLYATGWRNQRQRSGTPRFAASFGPALAFSLFAVSAALPTAAHAETKFLKAFTGSQMGYGNNRSAMAEFSFDTDTNDLIITLTNAHNAANETVVSRDILTGFFFTLDPVNPVLGGDGSVFTGAGSVIVNDPKYVGSLGPSGLDVSGEWAFKSGSDLAGITTNNQSSFYGVSASGLDGAFTSQDRFSRKNLWGNSDIGGVDGGLVGLNYAGGAGKGSEFIKNSIKITLQADPANGSLRNWLTTDFNNIQFQYGTSKGDTRFAGTFAPVPEPGEWATYLIMGGSLGAVVFRARKRRNGAVTLSA